MQTFSIPPLWRTGLVVTIVAAICAGCSDSDPMSDQLDELGHPPSAMVASWTFQSVSENGSEAALAEALDWDPAATAARLHILLDGPYVYEEVNVTGGQLSAESGWVFVDEEGPTIEFHVQFTEDGVVDERFTVSYVLEGNMMNLTRVQDGSTFVFPLVK